LRRNSESLGGKEEKAVSNILQTSMIHERVVVGEMNKREVE
jgi:hypothetical protein